MDTRDEFRELLTTRRARLTPEQAGLPTYDTRRVPGLRREEVALLPAKSEKALNLLASWTATRDAAEFENVTDRV